MKCDLCTHAAVYHLTDIDAGTPVTRHLCETCGKDQVPRLAEGPTSMDASQLAALRHCARCGGPTAVVVFAYEDPPQRSVRRFGSRVSWCAACAAAEKVAYVPAPAGHVAVVFDPASPATAHPGSP